MAEEREAIHAYLSVLAHSAWVSYSEENGVSVTGLLEALGREMADKFSTLGDLTEYRQDWVKRGRKIDAERRRRGRER